MDKELLQEVIDRLTFSNHDREAFEAALRELLKNHPRPITVSYNYVKSIDRSNLEHEIKLIPTGTLKDMRQPGYRFI